MQLNVPDLGRNIPRRGNRFSALLARSIMRLLGWRFEGSFPDLAKFVVIVAPHTSNWDFGLGVVAMFAVGFRGTFLGKHTLFRWPMGIVMRWLGGVPVDRSGSHNVVDQVVEHFRSRPSMMLALSPEGTRRKLPAWRTGFYNIAKGAGVPIVPVAFDYPHRVIRLFPPMQPTADQGADFAMLGAYFNAQMALRPAQY
jgi:1-acyl-sn-glycerol-3-phosphate acyltransferase